MRRWIRVKLVKLFIWVQVVKSWCGDKYFPPSRRQVERFKQDYPEMGWDSQNCIGVKSGRRPVLRVEVRSAEVKKPWNR